MADDVQSSATAAFGCILNWLCLPKVLRIEQRPLPEVSSGRIQPERDCSPAADSASQVDFDDIQPSGVLHKQLDIIENTIFIDRSSE
jgi:hypothetical protein